MPERSDLVESTIDVLRNIYTLYSYTFSTNTEEKNWAIQRYKQGRWFVVEPFGNKLLFAPSRFVGYKNNNIDKHKDNPGDGKQTNSHLLLRKMYKEADSPFLSTEFNQYLNSFGITNGHIHFLIPYDLEVLDLQQKHQCYFVCPTHCAGQKEQSWKGFLKKNLIAIGWRDKDYSGFSTEQLQQEYLNDKSAITAFSRLLSIRHGDIICCTNNNYGLWGIGIATSSYQHQSNIHYAGTDDDDVPNYYSHYIQVAWLCYQDKGYIPAAAFNLSDIERGWEPFGTITVKDIPTYISSYLFKGQTNSTMNDSPYSEYIQLLGAHKNLILTGAPGTGKTFLAKAIASQMGAEFDFVQFHPSYDYTDFVEGLRPTQPDSKGNIGFERRDGIFKRFCKKAIEANNTPLNHLYPTSQASTDFENLYDNLLDDIQAGKVTLYSDFRNNTQLIVTIQNPEGNRKLRYGTREKPFKVRHLKKLYDYYLEHKEYDIKNKTSVDFGQIIGVTSDASSYRGVVQELLNRAFAAINRNGGKPVCKIEPEGLNAAIPKPFVFIIDEINRGELSKIFGELFFCIDPSYRGKDFGRASTQYQHLITDESDPFYKGFYIPENVYIIGTMNDIDRSIESIDFAIRRRFVWKEIKANDNTDMLDNLGELKDEVVQLMKDVNDAIWDSSINEGIDGLSTAYHIGGAYFMKLALYLNEDSSNVEEAYQKLWDNHLSIVISEYLRGYNNASELLEKIKSVYFTRN